MFKIEYNSFYRGREIMMNKKIHGIATLVFISLSFLLGIIVVFINSPIFGCFLAVDCILFFILTPKLVCRKCPCREECGHVLLGKLSRRLSPYCADDMGLGDLVILCVLILPLVVVPQFWLYRDPVFLVLFWTMLLVSAFDILVFVCPACGNVKCPLNKGYGRV